jgi:hypothetical protein
MRTLLALAADTLRALCSRRLFWLHVWLSIATALVFASIRGTPDGWTAGFGMRTLTSPWLRDGTPWESTLHCWVLSRAVRWWVAGAGVLMTLFATAAVLPESLESGQAAILMPKARRRSILLAGRFLGAIAYFIILTAFAIALLFLVLRWHMNLWEWRLWLALPAALLLYAPLQAVATLMGVLTKSTTAAVLVALLFGAAATALQEAAAKQPATPSLNPSYSSAALSPPTPDHDDDDSESWTAQFAGTMLRGTASIMPGPAPALAWAESHSCPVPPRAYRDLFRRLRLGKSGLEAAAAEAIATNSPQGRTAAVAGLASAAAGGSVISSACLVLAASLLRRRDL